MRENDQIPRHSRQGPTFKIMYWLRTFQTSLTRKCDIDVKAWFSLLAALWVGASEVLVVVTVKRIHAESFASGKNAGLNQCSFDFTEVLSTHVARAYPHRLSDQVSGHPPLLGEHQRRHDNPGFQSGEAELGLVSVFGCQSGHDSSGFWSLRSWGQKHSIFGATSATHQWNGDALEDFGYRWPLET